MKSHQAGGVVLGIAVALLVPLKWILGPTACSGSLHWETFKAALLVCQETDPNPPRAQPHGHDL